MIDPLDWIISVDDHIIEPPDLWVDRMPKRDRDRVPHVEKIGGVDTWVYEDQRSTVQGVFVAAHEDPLEYTLGPKNYHDLPAAYYDPVARIPEMDRDGVLASLCFPMVPRFCGQAFLETKDKALALRCLQTYNNWVIDEWAGAVPGRYISLIVIPLWDVQLALREVYRCSEKGAKAIAFSENPYALGAPSIHSGWWDPFLAAVNETKMPLCVHVGSSSTLPMPSPDAPFSIPSILTIQHNMAVTTWLYSGKLQRFPELRIVLAEGGIGWIPYLLERCERVSSNYLYLRSRDWSIDRTSGAWESVPNNDPDMFPVAPAELFRQHFYGCFIEDYFGAQNLDIIGIDNVMTETDYPHTDSLWPHSVPTIHKMLAGRSDREKFQVMQGNARRVFNFEPASYPMATKPG